MVPECKSRDGGNSDVPKRSCKVLPLSGKLEVLDKEMKKKNHPEVAKIHSKMNRLFLKL